jgi:DNA-binding MarR family transcriptional regulator
MENITGSAVFKLHRVTALIDRIADDFLAREHGIRYAPFLVLLMAGVLGPTSQQRIAANLGVSRASITQRLGGLVRDGLIAVEPHPTDARANLVRLTEPGRALLDRAWSGLEEHQDGLDEGVDQPALVAQLDRLLANGAAIEARS